MSPYTITHLTLQMMYAGTKLSLVKEADLTKVFEIRDLEDSFLEASPQTKSTM